jgi:hypothetical protein
VLYPLVNREISKTGEFDRFDMFFGFLKVFRLFRVKRSQQV